MSSEGAFGNAMLLEFGIIFMVNSFIFRLEVKSKSLDVVYNPGATKWIVDFFTAPHQAKESGLRQAARQGYHAMKRKTKQQLLNNWDNMVYGQSVEFADFVCYFFF